MAASVKGFRNRDEFKRAFERILALMNGLEESGQTHLLA